MAAETSRLRGRVPAGREEGLSVARELRNTGVATAVVKLGAMGAAVATVDGEYFVEPFGVNAIDTVEAGDSFNGGLTHAIEHGASLLASVSIASACGAL